MKIGKVIGVLWCTQKDENLEGLKLLIVEYLDLESKGTNNFTVAVDTVCAGTGDKVLVVSGSSARQTLMTNKKPVDSTIVGIIDRIDVEEKR